VHGRPDEIRQTITDGPIAILDPVFAKHPLKSPVQIFEIPNVIARISEVIFGEQTVPLKLRVLWYLHRKLPLDTVVQGVRDLDGPSLLPL
jgi:hypothetical protein